MVHLLLGVIYLSFISLGLPDALLGSAWPTMYGGFGVPVSSAGAISMIIALGTVVSSLQSSRLTRLLGPGKVTAASVAMTALALMGFSLSGSFWQLCLWAIPYGLGAGSVDTALNNYVALHYSARVISFLHCFFGIGVTISPFVLSQVIDGELGWRGGYRIAFGIQLAVTALLAVTLPVWGKVHPVTEAGAQEQAKDLRLGEIARIPGVKLMWTLFIASCAIECTCGNWASTFLVEVRHMAAEQAAGLVMLYYAGMALGRFLSGLLAARLDSWRIIGIGQAVLGAALAILLLPGAPWIAGTGLFLVGLGNGPLFPNFNYLTPRNFGQEASQAVMGTQMAASYAGILAAPAVCGVLGQAVHMGIFPVYLLVFYFIMLAASRKARLIPPKR